MLLTIHQISFYLKWMTFLKSDLFCVVVMVLAAADSKSKCGTKYSGWYCSFSIGIVATDGEFWNTQRRFSLHILRDFGFGRTILEDRILEEVNFFIKEMEKNTDKPFYPQPLLQKSVANVIASVTFGKRMDYDDPVFTKYMKIFNRSITEIGSNGIVNIFPFLR